MSTPYPPPLPGKSSSRTLMLVVAVLVPVAGIALWLAVSADGSSKNSDHAGDNAFGVFSLVLLAQLGLSVAAAIVAGRDRKRLFTTPTMVIAIVSAIGMPFVWVLGAIVMALAHFGDGGGSMGRPLRVRGRARRAELVGGEHWAAGPAPDPSGLDADTRRALEALWLRDAQTEHASVPAFARLSWLLAAAGAPAELLVWSHRAAIEEIGHARACFALAAGYGGRRFTVEPMPELLLGGLDGKADPRVTLAVESLSDGCQLEGFNADLAEACAATCTEPVTRAVLEQIARDERSHAELAWAIVAWVVARDRDVVEAPLATAAAELALASCPRAIAVEHRALVARASETALRAHGRLPDATWAALWSARVADTRARLAAMVVSRHDTVAA